MPSITFIVNRSSLVVKKYLLPTTLYLLLATSLSGCSLIGTAKPAALQVTSTPEASVFLDGKHLGKTPFFSDQLKSGSYTLKVTASEASYISKIDLYPSTLTVVNRELNNNLMAQSGEILWLEKGKNDVFIASNPTDAEITIDGKYKGKTPLIITDLENGDHKVGISKGQGFIDREFAIKTSSKYKLVASVTLASELAKNPTSTESVKTDTPEVEIAKTPQGYLKVRKEPVLDSAEIGRVNTGDKLEIIQETEDWIKISFEGKLGWISKQYTKKI
ncbi:MAG: PEGA domain-containing protein [Patescibacteria group bacterium]